MKKYRIWFKSGNDIEGTMTDLAAVDLTDCFLYPIGKQNPRTFQDDEGVLVINMTQVEALAILPEESKESPCGFIREDN